MLGAPVGERTLSAQVLPDFITPRREAHCARVMNVLEFHPPALAALRRWMVVLPGWLAGLGLAAAQVPAVSSFTPASGPPGTLVTITGSGFSTATQFFFNDALADFTSVSASQIIAIVPTAATSGKLSASNSSGSGASAASFTVPPRIYDFSPPLGSPGTPVVINGANLTNTTAVRFNGTTATFTVTSEQQINATVPAGATDGPITVVTPVGSADSGTNFQASSRPAITEVAPLAATAGSTVTISGANFLGTVTVRFNGVAATGVTATGQGTQLSVLVPAGATTGPLTVTTAGGTATNAQNFVTGTQPIITDFDPPLGSVGDPVTINGLNFSGTTTVVKFNGSVATVSALSDTSIQAFVPTGATTGPIAITTPAGTGTSATNFVTGNGPLLTDFSPVAGAVGSQIVLRGLNFSAGGLVVKFNGVTAPTAVATAPGQIAVQVPNGATTGPISVMTTAGTSTSTNNFSVTGAAPFILGFTPTSGPRGMSLVITGINFTLANSVRFNGTLAPTAAVTADSQIQVEVPNGALTGPISVTAPAGTGTSSAIFYAPPRLTSFTPASGVAGSLITVNGTNFTGATTLTIASTNNTRVAVAFSLVASNQLTITIPTNAVTGPLVLTTPGGVIYSATALGVVPRVDSFAPTLGPVGTSVVLQGQNFANANAVRFNGVATTFTLDSPTQITATVPAGATTGTIQITSADGGTASTDSFLVTRATDLAITQSNAPNVFLLNQPATFFFTLTNRGPSTVTGVTVQDTFPVGMQFIAATSSVGTCSFSGGKFTCAIGVFSNAASASITLNVFNATAGVAFHQVSVSALEGDTRNSDNLSQALIAVLSDAQRTLTARHVAGTAGVEITWPLVLAPIIPLLQSAPVIAPNPPWNFVGLTPGLVTNQAIVYHAITQDTSGGPFFFRLKTP